MENYDIVAKEYNKNGKRNVIHQLEVLGIFHDELKQRFQKFDVLDVGCGCGFDLMAMEDLHNYHDTEGTLRGIDTSEEMLKYAKKNCKEAIFFHTSIHDFKTSVEYEGIIADAFIHLFPKKEIPKILNIIKSLLHDKGLLFLCTTKSNRSFEGVIEKKDYKNKIKRFRKFWTEIEMIECLEDNGFRLLTIWYDTDKKEKEWMNFIVEKKI